MFMSQNFDPVWSKLAKVITFVNNHPGLTVWMVTRFDGAAFCIKMKEVVCPKQCTGLLTEDKLKGVLPK